MLHNSWFRIASAIIALLVSQTMIAVEYDPPKPAPDFTLKSISGKDAGKNIKLSEQKGTVVLINFWASWCGPCREEMPLLNDLYMKYKKLGFTTFGVNVEADPSKALDYLANTQVDFPILHDIDSKVSEAYDVDAMPSTILVDRDGKARVLHRGYQKGYEKIYEKEIKKLIRE